MEKGSAMSCALFRSSAFTLAFLFLCGCGGSSGGNTGGGGGGGNSSTTVTFTFVGATPTAVATQIGSGSFTAAAPASTVTLMLPSGTANFAVAYVCPPISGAIPPSTIVPVTEERVFEASTLDGTSFSEPCPSSISVTGANGTLTGSVDASAIPGIDILEIYAQNAQNSPTGFPTLVPVSGGSFSAIAPAGTDRVMVAAFSTAASGNLEALNLVAAKNFSSQTVPGALNGGNTVVLSAADQTTTEPLTYQNVPSGYNAPTTIVGHQLGNAGGIVVADSATSGYPALPAAAVESGDSYTFRAITSSSSNPSQSTLVTTTLAGAGPESVSFPPAWSYAGPTPAAWPSFNLAYAGFQGKTGVVDEVEMEWSPSSTAGNIVMVTATANYLNGSMTVSVPNLSVLTGFIAPAASGTTIIWSAHINQEISLAGSPSSIAQSIVQNNGTYIVP